MKSVSSTSSIILFQKLLIILKFLQFITPLACSCLFQCSMTSPTHLSRVLSISVLRHTHYEILSNSYVKLTSLCKISKGAFSKLLTATNKQTGATPKCSAMSHPDIQINVYCALSSMCVWGSVVWREGRFFRQSL